MINIGEKYKLQRDAHCWILHEARLGRDRHGNPKTNWRTTYHADLRQAANKIIASACEGCDTAQEMLTATDNAARRVESALTELAETDHD
jgi:hypothetical protein